MAYLNNDTIHHDTFFSPEKRTLSFCNIFININKPCIQKKIFVAILFISFYFKSIYVPAQSCQPVKFQKKEFTVCNQNCVQVKLTAPNIKSTAAYRVSSIPYTPLAYKTAAGNTDPDDIRGIGRFGNVHNISFPFCLYDSVFSNFVLSPSGLLTFEVGVAQCSNNAGCPFIIPSTDAPSCNAAWYYPKSSIFGCYASLDPGHDSTINYFASPADRRIEWREEASAPCRRLVVSYYRIGSLLSWLATPDCSFSNPTTFQMILYESTGIIDVNIENYTCLNQGDNGRAILGIQNWNRDKGIAPPGKNATVWTAHNEAYRFTPSGGASRFAGCKLYTLNGSFVANADTATNATDSSLLNIQFNNVCPGVSDTTKYIVETSFIACPSGNIISSTDTITLIKKQLNPVISNSNGTLQTGSYSAYQWLYESNSIPNANNQTYTPTQSGYYQVVVTDSTGCIDTSAVYNYSVTPVTLLHFTARYNNSNANILNWQTSQEINSKNFFIQRAYTLPQFTTIGSLPAAGNSSIEKNYTFTDSTILYQPTFYRLQQVDRDGRYKYSNTVMVHPIKNMFYISSLYPNPASTVLHVSYNSISALPVTVLITDMLGRQVQKTVLPAVAGFNKAVINIAAFAKGKYVLRLFNEQGLVQEEFMKY